MSGKLIVFEGVNGCGKTTQMRLTSAWLGSQNIPVTVTREPGGTPLAEQVRSLILSNFQNLDPTTELLGMVMARSHHVVTVIKPALERGDWVLCDRFTWSTLAFQGYGRGLDLQRITFLNAIACQRVEPDLVIWLELDSQQALMRKSKSETLDRIESDTLDFHRRVARGYGEIFMRSRQVPAIRVDGSHSKDEIFDQISGYLAKQYNIAPPDGKMVETALNT